jgi:single-stranded-DNA-specific exonuclease
MLDAKARWVISDFQETAAAGLAEELKLHPLVAKLLSVRGIVRTEEARQFLYGGAEQFHDPFLLKGMTEAAARIKKALDGGEKIRVYGDYDADGISSTTLMDRLMKRLGADFDVYIPHRIHEGYGLNREALDQAAAHGVKLIVTVDTGISAREEIAYAAGLGMDVVVTDHHEPPEKLPEAAAIVNPKQPGCPYPCKELAGVGVAFKLAHALLGSAPLEWAELAAIGTVADLMPLVDENRLIVKLGLEQMKNTSSLGLRALFNVAGVDRQAVNETHIGFSLAPRINASGRMSHASLAVRLLTTEKEQEAENLALELDSLNKDRQRIVEEITKEALLQLQDKDMEACKVIVVAGEGWNVGVVGIVASKLLERFYRPSIVLAIDPETQSAKGSARSIAGFDMYQGLTSCSELLEHYGGHQAAAGLTLPVQHIPLLQERLELLAGESLTEEDFIPVIRADAACSLEETDLPCIDQLSKLAPFGSGNPAPRFIFEGLRIAEKRTMGREQQHLKLLLEAAEAEAACSMEAVGFHYGGTADRIANTSRLDVLGELSVNVWNGTRKPQILIQDLRITGPQLFDWRGAKTEANGKAPACPDGCGILVFSRAEEQSLPEEWRRKASIWCSTGNGEPAAVNKLAEESDFAELKDLVIYSLPPFHEWLVRDLSRIAKLQRIYAVFADAHGGGGAYMPDRDAFKGLYALIAKEGQLNTGDERIWPALKKRLGLSRPAVELVLQVFEELGFLLRSGKEYRYAGSTAKRDLTESPAYSRQMNRARMEQLFIYSTASELRELLLTPPAARA